ncbi:MAG: hypothetical protein PHH08_03390 [Candidatus ainarchaeum sp.]|nr:hypothetical protein [Candidatus ainarchaeum sp.]
MQRQIPELNLAYLKGMTDSFGLFQHAKFERPNKKTGYALDDNARALIVAIEFEEFELAKKYLDFIKFCQHSSGMFHNKISYRREKRHAPDIGDCFGRTIWACGYAMQSKAPEDVKRGCAEIFEKAKRFFPQIHDPKTAAYCLLGCTCYLRAKDAPGEFLGKQVNYFAKKIIRSYRRHSRENWRWFENILSYCNAKIPHSLFEAYGVTGKREFLDTAIESFDFLAKKTFMGGCFVPIGQAGWCTPDGFRSFFDQQPIEAGTMTEAAISAYNATKDQKYREMASDSFEWFFGKNLTSEVLYNPKTHGIFDGIAANTINENQGAESILAYLIAGAALKKSPAKN